MSGGRQKVKMTPVESFFKLFHPVQPPVDGTIGLNEYEEIREVRIIALSYFSFFVSRVRFAIVMLSVAESCPTEAVGQYVQAGGMRFWDRSIAAVV